MFYLKKEGLERFIHHFEKPGNYSRTKTQSVMDLIDEEPRRHPKPVPFCQNALLKPTVPEVSLLMQDNLETKSSKKTESFTGIEFQTYNSWRWKNMKSFDRSTPSPEPMSLNKHNTGQECFLIKDKYFTSDIEKRKNEILYGELEEPRRPLPPRASPVIPSCVESFFSSSSFDDLKPVHEPQQKASKPVSSDKNMMLNYSNQIYLKKELDNSEKLYSIISEQNKQMQVLQNQIEQLLKLQETKDKQTEQLLKCQESKEKKIEQLLQALDNKDKEIRQLTSSRDKQEQHLQELLKARENLQKENLSLSMKLNEIQQKEVCSIGVMACVEMADIGTCTSLDGVRECDSKKGDNTVEEDISCVRDGSRLDERDKSLSLHSSDLPVIQENAPTPQSSIHVDIQDFPDSSDDSESEAGIPSNRFSALNEVQSSPLGYTFYNNVLTQLKDIIQNSGEKESHKNSNRKSENLEQVPSKPATDYNFVTDNRCPLQSFQTRDVFEKENVPSVGVGEGRNERFSEEFQNFCIKETSSPSDISLKINALAMKYLKQEQIPDFGMQTQIPTACQHDVTIYNVTNLSFGSMRYLDRYQMLPKVKENQKQMGNIPKNGERSPAEFLRRRKRLTIEENITSVGNILDITTLNQQPKLL